MTCLSYQCRLLICIVLLLFSGAVLGADNPTGNDSQSETVSEQGVGSDVVRVETLNELLETLESESARNELISHLETLIAIEEESQDEEVTLSGMLNLDETSSALLTEYLRFIESVGISDSFLGRLLLLSLAAIIILVAIFLNRFLAKRANRLLGRLRQRYQLSEQRLQIFISIQLWFVYLTGLLLFVYALFEIFELWPALLETDKYFISLIQFLFTVLFISLLVALIWELANGFMEYGLNESSHMNSARVQTLMPVVRNIALILIFGVAGLIAMSELGIDIMPLIAGAGVVGIALGFGAQNMVRDFLNGFVVILEDLVQVGDVVSLADRQGLVEKITLRKIQMRNLDGTVHTIPHSQIEIVDNLTKEYSYYLMDVGVAYRENTDNVIECLKQVDEDMRADDAFGDKIQAPLEVMGVDKFDDSAVIIRIRTKTRPHEKWTVGREFNRRIKLAFDEQNIEIPFPHRTLYFGQAEITERLNVEAEKDWNQQGKPEENVEESTS